MQPGSWLGPLSVLMKGKRCRCPVDGREYPRSRFIRHSAHRGASMWGVQLVDRCDQYCRFGRWLFGCLAIPRPRSQMRSVRSSMHARWATPPR